MLRTFEAQDEIGGAKASQKWIDETKPEQKAPKLTRVRFGSNLTPPKKKRKK